MVPAVATGTGREQPQKNIWPTLSFGRQKMGHILYRRNVCRSNGFCPKVVETSAIKAMMESHGTGHNDIRYNGIQHNDTQLEELIHGTQHNNAPPLC